MIFNFLVVFAAVFGAIVGSFINALSFRFNTGRGWASMNGRSRCMHCGHTLAAADLVPVFSFLFLRGRCRYCGSAVSFQYPLVECVAVILSVLVFEATPPMGGVASALAFSFWFVVWMTLLFTVVYDTKNKIIPWSCSIILALLALAYLFAPYFLQQGYALNLWALLAGPLLALPLVLLSLVSQGRWMGWGDGALELSLGWFLGLTAGASAFMIAFWSGALMGLALIAWQKLSWGRSKSRGTITMHSEIPFAPYLVFGFAVAYFLHVDFFSTIGPLF